MTMTEKELQKTEDLVKMLSDSKTVRLGELQLACSLPSLDSA